MSRPSRIVLLALAATTLAGCGSETTIATGKAEEFVRGQLQPAPSEVKCPDGVKAEEGKTFECNVSYADGDRGTVTVHMTDDEGGVQVGPGDLHLTTPK